jgi:NADH dehydrogenase [ubiquinone] 1 alpha subcomplex assembly factor 7
MPNAKKLSFHDFMAAANERYYAEHVGFGQQGDFYTSPEITPVFGELIGLSLVDIWQKMGSPSDFAVIELGPGRGTLMADIMRVAGRYWGQPQIHLVETSPKLKAQQAETLAAFDVSWHDRFSAINIDRPFLLVANEFFDALPVAHFRVRGGVTQEKHVVETDGDWVEEWIDCVRGGQPGEQSPLTTQIFTEILAALKSQPGFALIIDYGYVTGQVASSVQACRGNKRTSVYDKPGQTDISAYVNFGELRVLSKKQGIVVYGPTTQAAYLTQLGLAVRMEQMLKRVENPHKHLRAARILIDPLAMGDIFKVMGVGSHDMGELSGFGEKASS